MGILLARPLISGTYAKPPGVDISGLSGQESSISGEKYLNTFLLVSW
jgi:hypothetical protein